MAPQTQPVEDHYIEKPADPVIHALEDVASAAFPILVQNGIRHRKAILDIYVKSQSTAEETGAAIDGNFHIRTFTFRGRTSMECVSIVEELTTQDAAGIRTVVLDISTKIQELAEDKAREITESFILKNAERLHVIVDLKGRLSEVSASWNELSSNYLGGDLHFVFEDGSSFTAHSSIIFKHSVNGLPFEQYPLSFTDVLLPDGELHKRMSEEDMTEVFATYQGGHSPP